MKEKNKLTQSNNKMSTKISYAIHCLVHCEQKRINTFPPDMSIKMIDNIVFFHIKKKSGETLLKRTILLLSKKALPSMSRLCTYHIKKKGLTVQCQVFLSLLPPFALGN